MFYFGIPLISKKAAVNWEQTVDLLNATLASIAQQSCDQFHCLIACHDIPPINKEFKKFVTFLQVDAPIPTGITEMRQDKGRKKRRLSAHFVEQGEGYLMFLDSDDLVHKDLVKYALETDNPNGYIVQIGYEYNSHTNRLMRRNNFNNICGSCGIFRLKPEDREVDKQSDAFFYNKLQSHKEFDAVCAAHNRPLQPIPFPAVVYLRTADITISTRFFKAKGLRLLKQQIREQLQKKKLTPNICEDFRLRA